MFTIEKLKKEYFSKINSIEIDFLISHIIKKEREFILTHPERILTSKQKVMLDKMIKRRLKNEPLAYILEEKEFYGLKFKVNKYTLIPRPETELIVEIALEEIFNAHLSTLNTVDIGTGSGNIIISLAHSIKHREWSMGHGTWNLNSMNRKPKTINYFATDISKEALRLAKKNAKLHNLNKKIKFLHGNLLNPIIHNSKLKIQNSRTLILANLPYLSKDIYENCSVNVKKYEPKTALYSAKQGLAHYNQLLGQIFKLKNDYPMLHITCLMEISPEQKKLLPPLIKKQFPKAKIKFKKDLAQKWRICKIII